MQRQSSGVLTVSTSPDFAAKWLVHRLGRFSESHPEIDLRISATMHHVDFAREDVDLAVRHGDGNWPGHDVIRLSPEQLFAVCSPKLLAGRHRLVRPSDVLKFPLLHLDDRKAWTRWLEVAGVRGRRAFTRAGVESRQHGYRCRGRRPGNSTCAHHACRVGPHLLGASFGRSRMQVGFPGHTGSCARRPRLTFPRSSCFRIGCWPKRRMTIGIYKSWERKRPSCRASYPLAPKDKNNEPGQIRSSADHRLGSRRGALPRRRRLHAVGLARRRGRFRQGDRGRSGLCAGAYRARAAASAQHGRRQGARHGGAGP